MSKGSKISPRHSHQFEIADHDAVQELLKKLNGPDGCEGLDEEKLCQAIETAASQYDSATEDVRQAFFHGLLTGYSVVIQTQRGSSSGSNMSNTQKRNEAGTATQSRSKAAGR